MRIYISLPITGREKEAREKADRVKTMLSKMGHGPINPFEIYIGPNATYGQCMGADVTALIDHAEAIFLCKGWRESKGCKIEKFVAETCGKKVIYEERDEQDAEDESKYYYR